MEYDFDKVMPTNPTVEFFEEHHFEIIACCMRLQPNTEGLNTEKANQIRFEAMDIITKEYEFGKYRHLCKTCYKNPESCNADPMFGKCEGNLNVCFCEGYDGELNSKTVSKGLSGIEHPKKRGSK